MDTVSGLTRDVLDRARRSRDARFDGRFFIAVKSTRIYCRPVCPSRFSNDSNIRYYATAAEAAEAGYRPCLRCRPETAPGSPAWLGTSAVVRRALTLIQDGALDRESVSRFSERLGIGVRHLARLFAQHVGVPPVAVAQTRRLHLAKQLLDETHLSITSIAAAAGFSSIRRFNDTFRATYGRSPRNLRKGRQIEPAREAEIALRLAYRPPYDWEHMSRWLGMQAIRAMESVDAGYTRSMHTKSGHAVLRVRPLVGEHALELRIWRAMPADLPYLICAARRMFDLTADPAKIESALRADQLLRPLVARRPGLRIPGVWDLLECGVRAILQGSGPPGRSHALLSELVQFTGEPIPPAPGGITRLFPSPAALAEADLGRLEIPHDQREAIRQLAAGIRDGLIRRDLPEAQLTQHFSKLSGARHGMGSYLELRALGDPDAFPSGDLRLRRIVSASDRPVTPLQLEARAEAWRPFRGYAALHLWERAMS